MYSLSGSDVAAPAQPAVFSKAILDQSTMGDRALQAEVIGLFRSQFGKPAELFGSINATQDWRFAAHSLRGTAAALGALEVTELAALMEHDGIPAGKDQRLAAIRRLDMAVGRFMAEVAAFT